jgi:hypothetical protein
MKTASSKVAAASGESVPATVLEPAVTAWPGALRDIARYRPLLLPAVATVVVFAGQLVEDLNDSEPIQLLGPNVSIQRWTVVAVVAFIFASWAFVERTVGRSLPVVRPLVKVDDARFGGYAVRMRSVPAWADALLFLASVAVTLTVFVGMRADLLVDDPVTGLAQRLPGQPALDGLILAGYAVVGWAILRLVYATARLARWLGRLTRERLEINVFDTSPLVPFGSIALALALAPAGVIVILVVGLGSPTTPVSWSILVEATLATVLALLLPLAGIHRQMSSAKAAASTALTARMTELYGEVTDAPPAEASEWARLSNTTNAVVQMRKAVQEMTTWPFRDTLAFSRALLIATAPLIYTTLSELIKVFWIGPLAR